MGFVGFVGLVVGYEVEEVTRLRESSSYGYSNIEAEANFVKFSEVGHFFFLCFFFGYGLHIFFFKLLFFLFFNHSLFTGSLHVQ